MFLRFLDTEFAFLLQLLALSTSGGAARRPPAAADCETAEVHIESPGGGVAKILSLQRSCQPAGSRRREAEFTQRAGVRPL